MSDLFGEAIVHHRAGRLDQAAEIYRAILASNPQHADCLNLLGVIMHQRGNSARAVELIERAIQIDPHRNPYYVNLAAALRGLGRHEEAMRWCRAVLEIDPDLFEAQLALAQSFQGLKQWSEAEQIYRRLTERHIGDSRPPQALANCLREQGRFDEAMECYLRALERNPNDGAAHLGLGTVLLGQLNAMAAETYLRRATELSPGVASAWVNYGACLVKLSREREAIQVLEEGLRRAPNELGLGVNLGQALLACGDHHAAENCFNEVLKRQPNHAEAISGLADIRRADDRVEEAIPLYEKALEIDPMGNGYKGLSESFWDVGDVDRAAATLQKGAELHPRDPENRIRLATMLSFGGDLKAAEKSYRQSLEVRSDYPVGLIGLAQTLRAKLPKEDEERLKNSLEQQMPNPLRGGVHFALAQVSDANDNFAAAAEHLRRANALTLAYNHSRGQGYDHAKFTQDVDRVIRAFSPEFFERVKGFGVNSERPVFVFGMPRSGTTLIEQILASHPQVHGAGERRFTHQSLLKLVKESHNAGDTLQCMKELTKESVQRSAEWHLEQLYRLDSGKAMRVVDKMPENYLLLGWLAVQFPKARLIHSRRDVRDVAFSCWMTNFSMARWANDLEHIASRVRDYQRLMEYWRGVLPLRMLEMDYEKLVADQEGESRRLVAWLGLEWHPACLQFHKTERLVKTASVTQVRQPMYTRSVGRWKNYQEAMKPFLKAMEMAN